MKKKLSYRAGLLILFFLCPFLSTFSQGLLDELDEISNNDSVIDYTYATFKGTRVVNGQSIENIPAKELNFIIGHRFGPLNGGAYELFGLDQAQIRFALAYSLNNRIMLEVGRSNFQKTYDLNSKIKLLRQSKGAKKMPISASFYTATALNTIRWNNEFRDEFTSRLSYVHQLIMARKFNDKLSLQVSPSLIHINLVETTADPNTIFASGFAGRYKLTSRVSLNVEYYWVATETPSKNFNNPLSVGFDIETGGHVFQLHLTNSMGLFDRNFIAETTGAWNNGGIMFGFNVNRVFTFSKH